MFDDFVSSSKGQASSSQAGRQGRSGGGGGGGFEPVETATDVLPITALETGFISDNTTASTDHPIFQLGRVQYAFQAPLAHLTVASNILTMCLYAYPSGPVLPQNLPPPPHLVRINLDEPERTLEGDVPTLAPLARGAAGVPLDASGLGPHKMFADPSGRHLVLSMRSGDNFYWASGWKKARLLSKWKGVVVESIAWHPRASSSGGSSGGRSGGSSSSTSSREILVGSHSGTIYEAVLVPPSTNPDDEEREGDFLDRLARRTAGAASNVGVGGGGADIDRVFRPVFTLSERQPVSGLSVTHFNSSAGSSGVRTTRAAIVATTSTRIYEFVGALGGAGKGGDGQSLYARVFEPYKGAVPNLKSELPGAVPHSELRVWSPPGETTRTPKALAWLTGPGVYHGLLSFVDQDVGDSVIDSANLLPYPAVEQDDGGGETVAEIPLGIALTEFHFVLLYENRVMCISSLDDRVIFAEPLPLRPQERVVGVTVDATRKTYWIHTDSSIFELVIHSEDRDVWRVYLERGSHDMALRHTKNAQQREVVLSAQGDRFYMEGRYIQAAQAYAQSFTRTFEEVVLRLLDVDARDALRYYLVSRLERLRRSDTTQRILLATWLVEIYLGKLDDLDDVATAAAAAQQSSEDVDNYKLEASMVEEELRQFVVTYKEDLDRRTTFSLIARHGRSEVMLHYAAVVGEHERVLRYWIERQEWEKAVSVLSGLGEEHLHLYYKFSTILMRNAPRTLVDAWLRQSSLQPRKLIPAMLQHKPSKGEANQATRYLRHVIWEQDRTDSAVHNFYLTLLARDDGDGDVGDSSSSALLSFLLDGPTNPLTGLPYFDLDYALRLCTARKLHGATVRIFAKMGLDDEAVDLALKQGDVDLACACADEAGSNLATATQEEVDGVRRKLWLRVAKHVVTSSSSSSSSSSTSSPTTSITEAISFLSHTPLLTIEDVLPFFPDFTLLDPFRSDVCSALDEHAARIEALQREMDAAARSAEHIREDIQQLGRRFVTVEADEGCGFGCWRGGVLGGHEGGAGGGGNGQFYVFPCRHCFHADCLVEDTTSRLPPRALRRLVEIQAKLATATGLATVADAAAGATPSTASSLGKKAGANATTNANAGLVERLPEALISVLSAGVNVGVASSKRVLAPLDPFLSTSSSTAQQQQQVEEPTRRRGDEEKEREVARLRDEMDAIIAAACPLCEGSLADLQRPFVGVGGGRVGSAAATGTAGAKRGGGGAPRKGVVVDERHEEERWAL